MDYCEEDNVKETTVLIDPDAKDRKGLYGKELEIYLDELDNRTSDMSGATCNGFTEDRKILDFPKRYCIYDVAGGSCLMVAAE